MFIAAEHKLVWQYPQPVYGACLPLLFAWFPLSPPAKTSLFATITLDAVLLPFIEGYLPPHSLNKSDSLETAGWLAMSNEHSPVFVLLLAEICKTPYCIILIENSNICFSAFYRFSSWDLIFFLSTSKKLQRLHHTLYYTIVLLRPLGTGSS